MRRQQSTILYIFIFLIILLGLALFIFKDSIVDQLLSFNIDGPVVNVNKNSTNLNLDILNDSRIKVLKNYVSVFDYQDLDKSQEAILANLNKQNDVTISNPDGAATTSTAISSFIRVRVGNSNPFLVNKTAK